MNQFGVLYSENQFCTIINISSNILFDLFICFTQKKGVVLYLLPQNFINDSFFEVQQNLPVHFQHKYLAACLEKVSDQFEYSHTLKHRLGLVRTEKARVCVIKYRKEKELWYSGPLKKS